MTRHPIREAYEATGALIRECPMCQADPGQWCTDPRGRIRRVPCVVRSAKGRISNATPAEEFDFKSEQVPAAGTASRDYAEPLHQPDKDF